ncbi:MAG: hotdog fold thioesterase [Acidobacteriota bacterium]|nr:hotdog fold thioesterase [Acidobacteriota bacterium]
MTNPHFDLSAEQLNAMSPNTLMEALGIEFLEPTEGRLCARMPVDGRTHQPLGLLHGGASVALAETLGSTASYLLIDQKKQFSVGQAINAHHIRSARDGWVEGVAEAIHLGRTSHIWEIHITQDEKLITTCRLTMAIRDRNVA